MKTVEIYTKSWCGYCRMARAMLEKEGIPFEEIDVTYDSDREEEMMKRSGRRTVPQIFIDNEAIGGFTDLVQLASHTSLQSLLTTESQSADPA